MVAVAVVVVVVSAVAWAMANYIHVPSGSPEVPKLDVTVQDQEEQRCREGALSLLQHLRPHWDPQEVTLQVTPTLSPRSGPAPRDPGLSQHVLFPDNVGRGGGVSVGTSSAGALGGVTPHFLATQGKVTPPSS